jgi:hypothetical protein
MKTIIAGSRGLTGAGLISSAVSQSGFDVTEVVSGTARGIDSSGEDWAWDCQLPVKRFPADWKTHGRSAGYKRNEQMAAYADALIAIWDGKSRGTQHMVDIARKEGLEISVFTVK